MAHGDILGRIDYYSGNQGVHIRAKEGVVGDWAAYLWVTEDKEGALIPDFSTSFDGTKLMSVHALALFPRLDPEKYRA